MRPRNSRRNNHQRSTNVLQNLGDLKEFYDQLQKFADLTHEIFRKYSNNRHCNCSPMVSIPQKHNNKHCCHHNCQHRRKCSTERKHPPQIHYEREESRPSGSQQRHSSQQYNDRSGCSCVSNRKQLPKLSNHSSMCMILENSDYSKCKRRSLPENQGTCGANSSMNEHYNKCSRYPERSKKCGGFFHGNNNCSDSQRGDTLKQRETNDNLESCTCDYCQCMPDIYNGNNIFMDIGSDDEFEDSDSLNYTFKAIRLEPVDILLQDCLETENGQCTTSDKNTQTFMQDVNESTRNNLQKKLLVNLTTINQRLKSEQNFQTARNSFEPNISSPKESKRENSQSKSFSEKEQIKNNENNDDENNQISESKPIQVGSIEESSKVESIQDIHKESKEFEKESPAVENNQIKDKEDPSFETERTNPSADKSKQNNVDKEDDKTRPEGGRNAEFFDIEINQIQSKEKFGYEIRSTQRSTYRNEQIDKDKEDVETASGRNANKPSYESRNVRRSVDGSKQNDIDKDVETRSKGEKNIGELFDNENNAIRDKKESSYETDSSHRSANRSKQSNMDKEEVETKPASERNTKSTKLFDFENNLIKNKEKSGYENKNAHSLVDGNKQNIIDKEDVETKSVDGRKTKRFSDISNVIKNSFNQVNNKVNPRYVTGSTQCSVDISQQNNIDKGDVETKPASGRNTNVFSDFESNLIRDKEKSGYENKNGHSFVDGNKQNITDKEDVETKSVDGRKTKRFSDISNVNQNSFNQVKNKDNPRYETGGTQCSIDISQQNNMDKGDVETKPASGRNTNVFSDFENNLIRDKEKSHHESRNARRSLDRNQQNDIDMEDLHTKLADRTNTKKLVGAVNMQFRDKEKFSYETENRHHSEDRRKQDEIVNDDTKPKDIKNNQLANFELSENEIEKTRPSFEKKHKIDIHKETTQTKPSGTTNTKESFSIKNSKIECYEKQNHKTEIVPSNSNRNILKLMGEKICKIVSDKSRRPEETGADKNIEMTGNDKASSRKSTKELPVNKKNQNQNEKQYKKHTTNVKQQKPDTSDEANRPTKIEAESELSYSNDEEIEMVDKIVQTSSYRNLTLEDLEIQTSNTLLEGLRDIENNNKRVPKRSSNHSTTESHNLKKTNRNNKK
ncbi:putative uncharacterized protein DDB_G0282133 [Teleopsis dalmanni]|uniref:putative uncharacterized protein DDB_G0282133 n=1 Tax=Teleopsis dalmanni TaxID=139649 RepID=UPI0018CDF647|nr:putative uncharacterized protein DDB_G0282133 [Teleopsis dalmanni]